MDQVTISRELLRQVLDEMCCTASMYDAWKALRAALDAPAVEPVAVASIYITPDGEREFDDWKVALPIGRTELYTAPQAQQPAQVVWGVDWGSHGDRSCVSVIKKHANGVHEIVATEYGPIGSAQQPRKAVKLTADEVNEIYNKWVAGTPDGTTFTDVLEQAVLKKNGVTE